MRAGALFFVWAIAGVARADLPPPSPELGYHLHLAGLEPSMAVVDVWQSATREGIPVTARVDGEGPYAGYVVLDPHSTDMLHRLCVLPASWLLDGPLLGALGPRMVRGASVVSGDVVSGEARVASLRRVFESPEVACSDALPPLPTMTDEMRAEEIAGVEDTLRLAVEGSTLTVTLVETIYRREGGTAIGLPAIGGTRPPLTSGACGCRAGGTDAPLTAMLVLFVLVVWRRQR